MWCPKCGSLLIGKIIEQNQNFDCTWEELEEASIDECLFLYCPSCGYNLGNSVIEYSIESDDI